MDKYYKKFVSFLISNQFISNRDYELYVYAVKIVSHSIFNTMITLFVGIALGMLKECLCILFVFFFLRKFTGGLHAIKYANCVFWSVILLTISLCIIKYCVNLINPLLFLCFTLSFEIIICVLAPADNVNKPLSHMEKKVYKVISICVLILLNILILYNLNKKSTISYSLGLGIMLISFLLLISFFKLKKDSLFKY